VRAAVKRGVWVYGYLNVGALEKERPYYPIFKHLRLAPYDGWDGEYWVDVTDSVTMLTKEGFELRHEVFLHDAPAPEPEPEAEGTESE